MTINYDSAPFLHPGTRMKRIAIIGSSCSGKTLIELKRMRHVDQWVESLTSTAVGETRE